MFPDRGDWVVARVVARDEPAPGLVVLRFDRAAVFVPGQFLQLGLPGRDGSWVARSYSVASRPGEPVEVFVVAVPGGALSPRLADLGVGEPVGLGLQPDGHFKLERVPDAEVLWLMATGTGLAPYLSMLRGNEPWERFGRVVVVHGVRRTADLAYGQELTRLSAAHGGRLGVVAAVTRDPGAPGVLHGRIPALIESGALEAAAGAALDPSAAQVMLCGNPEMVAEVSGLLAERGLLRNRPRRAGHVTSEKYW